MSATAPSGALEPRPDPVVGLRRALGFLIAGAVNSALSAIGDDDAVGCCPQCCGPCGALVWLRDHNPAETDAAVMAIMSGPTDRYDWQDPATLGVDWDLVGHAWAVDCLNAEWHEGSAL